MFYFFLFNSEIQFTLPFMCINYAYSIDHKYQTNNTLRRTFANSIYMWEIVL